MPVTIDERGLDAMLSALHDAGYEVIGPTVREGAVVHAEIRSIEDLPQGVSDEQGPGSYRLGHPGHGLFFGFAAAAASWKPFLYPPRRTLWTAAPDEGPEPVAHDSRRRALVGVRSCDLHAIAVQDRVLAGREQVDPEYVARREGTFVVAVTCGHPGGTCFCVSMGTGPRPDQGYDVALTELLDDEGHRFLVETGSERGEELVASLAPRPATSSDAALAEAVLETARGSMGRTLDTTGLRDLLYANADSPRWDQVAGRCLSCTNCTMVCPTCFCVSTADAVDLDGTVSRSLEWDSCFHPEHSQLHDGPVRRSTTTRYRQWLTHKFGSWIDQFGTSGCVGCGRCVTWCPVGIDVTEELAAIRATSLDGGAT